MHASDRVVRTLSTAVGLLLVVALVVVGFVPPAVVILSIPFLVVAARKPVLRRLAVRNASRRPRETALILLGALLGTAIITGSATVGDTLGSSIRQGAFTQLGPIDEIVRSPGLESEAPLVAAVRAAPQDDIDGILPIRAIDAAIATAEGTEAKAEPNASLLEIDFAAAREFGGDPEATGIDGPTPAPGHAAIGKDLARLLDVRVGDTVDAFAFGAKRTFTIDAVLPRRGVAGLHFGFGSSSPNLFVTPGTIADLVAANPAVGSPPGSMVAVSNRGGVIDGADLSSRVTTTALEPAIAESGLPAHSQSAKVDLLDAAEAQGKSFTQLFTSLGTFSALAGILLLISIFIMLAEERKTELGMLRAVGLKRAGLVGSFSLEGWMYAVGAAALGTIAGLGVGRAIVFVTAGIFSGEGRFALELNYTATRASIQQGFFLGFLFSLVTVLATSWWISRLNVIRAIRDLPEPTTKPHSVLFRAARLALRLVLAAAGAFLTLGGISGKAPAPLLLGPPVLLLGVALLVRSFLNKRAVDTIAAALSLLWASFCFDVAGEVFNSPDISLFVLDGVILTVAGVMLVSRHQSLIGSVVRRIGGGSRNMSLRLGLAYPLAKAFRTSLILSTFTLVMFTLVSMTLFSDVFSNQIDDLTRDISGGFDGQAFSNTSNPAPVDAIRGTEGVVAVAPLTTAGAQFDLPKNDVRGEEPAFRFGFMAGYDDVFVEGGPPSLGDRLPRFASEDAVWRAVLADPSLVIVSESFLQDRGGPPRTTVRVGDPVLVRNPETNETHQLQVAALADTGFGGSPAYLGADAVRAVSGTRAVTNLVRFKTAPGVDPEAVARRLDAAFLANGLDASSFRQQVADGLATQQQFLRLMQGYLSLGLIVSVAGIGVVMVRAVRERRREVGVLRSLGFETKQVRRAFVAESSFVALEGIFLGTGLAIMSTWRLLTSGAFGDGLEFSVPLGSILVIVGLAFVATLAATASPAQQASRIRPAVALRIAD
ncbi:MAG TPA: FtsX-like permease family protein [Acidimicrobiales bacterium]|nr:FtsX-like permease family protein [Acidimicrobiales bacterium]